MPVIALPVYWCGVLRGVQIAVACRKARDASQSQIRELDGPRDLTWCGPRVTYSSYGLARARHAAAETDPCLQPLRVSHTPAVAGCRCACRRSGRDLRRVETLAGRPAQARALVGDHACLSKEQRPSAPCRVAGRCSDSSEGAVSRGSSSRPETAGFVGKESSRPPLPLLVRAGVRGAASPEVRSCLRRPSADCRSDEPVATSGGSALTAACGISLTSPTLASERVFEGRAAPDGFPVRRLLPVRGFQSGWQTVRYGWRGSASVHSCCVSSRPATRQACCFQASGAMSQRTARWVREAANRRAPPADRSAAM